MTDAILDLVDDDSGVSLRGKADDGAARRRELLERSNRGELVELRATILAYGQGGKLFNRKFTRFTPSALQQYARAAGSTLFQRDHSMATADTGGVILGGKVELNGDERALHEEIRLAYPWRCKRRCSGRCGPFRSTGARRRGIRCCARCARRRCSTGPACTTRTERRNQGRAA